MATKNELTKSLKFNIGGNEIVIRVKMAFVKAVEKWGAMRDSYSVVIEYDDDFITAKYYKSANDYNKGNRKVTKDDIANALYCIFSDAFCYCNNRDYDDFHAEYGGNYKVFKACEKTYYDLIGLFGDDDILAEIANKSDEGDYEIVKDDEK